MESRAGDQENAGAQRRSGVQTAAAAAAVNSCTHSRWLQPGETASETVHTKPATARNHLVIENIKYTASKRVLILRTWSWSLIRTFLAFWVLIYILGSLFSLFWFHSRKECQFSLHVYIFASIGSGLHCWQILILTYAYA